MKMQYCHSGTESLLHGSWNRHVCRWLLIDNTSFMYMYVKLNWDAMSRMSSVSPACRKRRQNWGGFSGGKNCIKRLAQCRCLNGHVREPYEMYVMYVALGARPSNIFFSSPAHLCAIKYMTEISFIVTLSTEMCWLGEGHNFCPLECRLSVGKQFPRRCVTRHYKHKCICFIKVHLLMSSDKRYSV